MKPAIFACVLLSVSSASLANPVPSSVDPASLPAFKQTGQGKYLSSADAFAVLTDDPDILFVDVRDPVEVSMTGRPMPVDAVVPVRVQQIGPGTLPDPSRLSLNPDFVPMLRALVTAQGRSRDDMIIVTCGSGRRSAQASRILEHAGFSDVWHVTDGYEGDDRPGFNAQHAWRDAGLPWTDTPVSPSYWQLLLADEAQP